MSICIDEYAADPRLILGYHVVPDTWLLQGGTTGGGGVMRWFEQNFADYERTNGSDKPSLVQLNEIAEKIALAAIKYGDLSNEARKDYVFDIDKFTSFEGNTGPYILYTMVRIKSIMRKYRESGGDTSGLRILPPTNETEKALMMTLAGFVPMLCGAWKDLAPHRICAYIYQAANDFNKFYHETKILTEEDDDRKRGYVALIMLTLRILETAVDILGFEAPDMM